MRSLVRPGSPARCRVFRCRSAGSDHLKVSPGDVSVPEGGAAADELAELPAGRGGGLPEQGVFAAFTFLWHLCAPVCLSVCVEPVSPDFYQTLCLVLELIRFSRVLF